MRDWLWLQVAKGLTYLHSKQIVHSDLKADNVLVAPGNVAKLCDFSFSQLQAFGQEESCAGTPGYCDGSGGEQGDIFSFGVFLWEVVCGQRPLPNNPSVLFPRAECKRLRDPPCALSLVEDESQICGRYHPVESGARLDHWFGPGSAGPMQDYGQVLQRCASLCTDSRTMHVPTMHWTIVAYMYYLAL